MVRFRLTLASYLLSPSPLLHGVHPRASAHKQAESSLMSVDLTTLVPLPALKTTCGAGLRTLEEG